MLTEVAIVYHQGPINKPCPNQALFFSQETQIRLSEDWVARNQDNVSDFPNTQIHHRSLF